MGKSIPSKVALYEVANRLKEKNIKFALGGSGLMLYYGCDIDVRDWDITTDESISVIEDALVGLRYEKIEAQGIYASKFLLKIDLDTTYIDLIGEFALKTENTIYKVPSDIKGDWDGIPVGDPIAWIKVYKLLGRNQKAQQLQVAINKKNSSV